MDNYFVLFFYQTQDWFTYSSVSILLYRYLLHLDLWQLLLQYIVQYSWTSATRFNLLLSKWKFMWILKIKNVIIDDQ